MNPRPVQTFQLAAVLLYCGGCQQEASNDVAVLQRSLQDLQRQVTLLQNSPSKSSGAFDDLIPSPLTAFSNQVAMLEGRIEILEGTSLDWTPVDLTKPNFSIIHTGLGRLFVSAKTAEPYLDGYRITVYLGNPTTADLDGCQLHIRSSITLTYTNIDAYNASVQNHVEDIISPIKAGSWTPVTFTLSPSTPERLRHLKIAIESKGISLTTPRR